MSLKGGWAQRTATRPIALSNTSGERLGDGSGALEFDAAGKKQVTIGTF
jgi:hypothetical protein